MSDIRGITWFLVLVVGLCSPAPAAAQGDTTLAAGGHYAASGLHRLLFGRDYRDLWTTPVRVRALDLGTFGGGLTPTTAGGGQQTKSLRFRGRDGFQYGFRSLDKDPWVPEEVAGTLVEDIVQDQTSSQHPASAAVVARLMDAADILYTPPELVVLPDDARLGEFRARFAGTIGYLQRRTIVEPGVDAFAGAAEIIDGNELFDRVRRGPGDQLDLETFLRARLFDLMIGDWDRHRGQWGWARFGDSAVTRWVPVPEDRDQAFVRFDGLLLSLARVYFARLVNYGPTYPGMLGLTWNGRELDRRFLVALERPVWDSVGADLARHITDSVIDAAVQALPPEFRAIDGERLAVALRGRRDALPVAVDRFYRFLARQVEIVGTDAAESVTVEREPAGTMLVSITSRLGGVEVPYFRRRFVPDETAEVRILLGGGADRVTVAGEGAAITLRIVGDAEDVVENRSRTSVRAYGALSVSGRARLDRRSYVPPPPSSTSSWRDWGSRRVIHLWAESQPDVGVFLGGGQAVTAFGFRRIPYKSAVRVRAGVSSGARTGRVDLHARFYRTNSRVHLRVQALASGIEVLRFYGLGNETTDTLPGDYYRVAQRELTLLPEIVLPAGGRGHVGLGPVLRYSRTLQQPDRIIAALQPYGAGGFGQVGVRGWFEVDTRDVVAAARRGVRLTAGGSFYPAVWDVQQGSFGELHAEASTYLTVEAAPMVPTLALRAGGKRVWGTYPYQEAAFLGDAASARLGAKNRFAGDGAVYGNAELRLQLAKIFLVLPGHVGVFGLGDLGRVFVDAETSSQWHWAVGGGIWIAYLQRMNTLSLALAKSRDDIAVYVRAGFAY